MSRDLRHQCARCGAFAPDEELRIVAGRFVHRQQPCPNRNVLHVDFRSQRRTDEP